MHDLAVHLACVVFSWLKDFVREGNCVEESRKERSGLITITRTVTFASSPRPPPRRPIQHGRDILLCTKCRSFVAEGLWSRRVSFVEGGWKKSRVCSVCMHEAGSDAFRCPGSSDELPGGLALVPLEDARGKSPMKKKGPEV
jgi:hypothetical protein